MNFRRFIDHPVKVCMLFAALVLIGLLSYRKLAVNLFPEVRTPRITLMVHTVGMAPEETVRRLTRDFERQIASIKGVSDITTYSRESAIVIYVDFHWGTEMDLAYLDVKKNVGALETGEYVEQIDVYRFDPNAAPLMTLAFVPLDYSDAESDMINRTSVTALVENILKPRLETVKGVAFVKASGTQEAEVSILVNEDVMAQYGLSPQSVMNAITERDTSAVGGTVIEGGEEMVLKFVSRFSDVEGIRRCVLKVVDDFPVRLEDIGRVEVTPAEEEMIVRQDGLRTVSLDVYTEPDANAIHTARRVRDLVNNWNQRGDLGLKISVDRSREVEAAVNEVMETALIGALLAMLVLWLFLRNIPATIVAASAIPISVIATFSLMYFQGLSLNIMTLGGLALGAGMLVDNAIVVMENIFRRKELGDAPAEAAATGTKEVAMAITAATLTTLVVFVPLIFVQGISGVLFKDQALTVVYSLAVSLLVALILIPMLAARLKSKKLAKRSRVKSFYGGFLRISLKARWLLFVIFIGLILLTVWMVKMIPMRFFPETVGGRITMSLEMPPGTPLEKTSQAARQLEKPLRDLRWRDPNLAPLLLSYQSWQISGNLEEFLPAVSEFITNFEKKSPSHPLAAKMKILLSEPFEETTLQEFLREPRFAKKRRKWEQNISKTLNPYIIVESVTVTVGTESGGVRTAGDRIYGPHTARLEIALNPDILKEADARDMITLLRSKAEAIPDLEYSFESRHEFLQNLLGKEQGDLAIEVHAEDRYELIYFSEMAREALAGLPGFQNVRTNLKMGEEAYVLEPDSDALLRGGFKTTDISEQVKSYLEGEKSGKIKLTGGEMKVVVRNQRAREEGLKGLLNVPIVSQQGRSEPLRNLVTVTSERDLSEIMRTDQERTILVMSDLDVVRYDEAVMNAEKALDGLPWKGSDASWNISGEEIKRRQSFQQLMFALALAVILVYMVIASILESLVHPFTIMLSVPLAFAGTAAIFLLSGISLNIMGLIGVVMLTGIVVNDAIILLDRINQVRNSGEAETILDAVVTATRQRLRPIVMTSMTTILALVPLALGFGNGAELRRPMALAVIGGLFSSTLLTLWILPGLYLCVEDVMGVVRKVFGMRREKVEDTGKEY